MYIILGDINGNFLKAKFATKTCFQIALCASDTWGFDPIATKQWGTRKFFVCIYSFTLNYGPDREWGNCEECQYHRRIELHYKLGVMLEVNKSSLHTLIQIFCVWDKNFNGTKWNSNKQIAELLESYKITK